MNRKRYPGYLTWPLIILLGAFIAACDGEQERDPIFGIDGGEAAQSPRVTAVAPVNNATGVPVNNTIITAAFSEPMAPLNPENFTVTCDAPCADPPGTVALDADGTTATFRLNPGISLEQFTRYTGTIDGATSLSSGLEILGPFIWQFTTGATPDTTRPRVLSTVPQTTDPGPTTGVATNAAISAIFTEDLDPTTIGASSFTLTCAAPCVSPTGTVSYSVGSRTAVFDPDIPLDDGTTYTATLTTEITDLAGNELAGNQAPLPAASDYVWTFTTTAAVPPSDISVLSVTPQDGATGVCPDATVNATFDVPSGLRMDPDTVNAVTFSVTGPAPDETPVSVASVLLDPGSGTIATFTPLNDLNPGDTYTAVVQGLDDGVKDLAVPANTMAGDFSWSFTVGPATGDCEQATPDTTRPRVSSTVPQTTDPGPTPGVATTTTISAVFTEDLDPSTVSASSFTLDCVAPCTAPGVVSYSVGSRTAVFDPDAPLENGTTYTATLTTQITDLAGNELAGNQAPLPAASDYVWTFTTAAAAVIPPSDISVLSVTPQDGATGVCPDSAVSATFDVPSGLRMDPDTVNAVTFSVIGPAPDETPVLAASVSLDPGTGTIATFTPLNDLNPGDTYTAVVQGLNDGVKDLAVPANTMASDFSWSFTVGPATGDCLQAVPLNSAAPFGIFGGSAGMTNMGIQTVINGDIGTTATATSSITGFHDTNGDIYTETPSNMGFVNGLIFTCTTSTTGPTSPTQGGFNQQSCDIATQGQMDAQDAFNELQGLPPGANPGQNLGGLTLAPGVYTAPGGDFQITGSDLTLDAQGDANAVWVFQMSTTLTIGAAGAPRSIILANGAQAKNIFWAVGSAATINAAGGGTVEGTIIAQAGVSISTAGNAMIVTVNGRALSLGASVTVVNTVINVPAP